MGVLLELGLAETIQQAESMVKKVRPQITVHEEFIRDLQKIFPNK
ncbi:hypothetical protein N0O92_03510 [Alkalihalobacillus sp. MEB130]|nr:hypothetical protein [Alkalihalobacillus sp. MEB130]MDT8859287.1 hypothetical protein [Alkalihalobacillus sp. MEB130]